MKKLVIMGAVVFLGAGPLSAQVFTAENGVKVAPVANGFSVTGDAGIGARGTWCGAADYARTVLGGRAAQRIYVVQGRKPGLSQRSAVVFSLESTGQTSTAATVLGLSLRSEGASLSIGHAYGFCVDHKLTREGSRS